jgi:hypothetical protein
MEYMEVWIIIKTELGIEISKRNHSNGQTSNYLGMPSRGADF